MLNPERFIKLQQPKIKMRKLALFGEAVSTAQINFQWPTEADLDYLGQPEYLRLRSLFFMSINEDYQPVSRVTCIYENGAKSPNIQSRDSRHEQQAYVTFDPNRPIRSIRASVYPQHKIPAIGFFDD